jgi:UTP--glucose-1-phosphate uridylyltransferase
VLVKKKTVTKAVIPAAGLGTRFLPITKSMPKEMLPLIDKPAIHYVVEEAIRSGIDDILIITGRGKRAIEDYFDLAPELEHYLEGQGKSGLLKKVREVSSIADIHFIRQKEPRGLGDAIRVAEKHTGDDPFAVLLGDDILRDRTSCTRQLKGIFSKRTAPVIAVQHVSKDRISRYGVISGRKAGKNLMILDDIIEKPAPEDAPSDLGAIGRYIFTPEIFACIGRTGPGLGGEIQLTDAIRLLCRERDVYAYTYHGKRYDTGDKLGYLETIVDFAIADDEVGDRFMAFLREKTRPG